MFPAAELTAHSSPRPVTVARVRAEPAEIFLENLGRALHQAGSPSHRIEAGMSLMARRLGIDAHFFATPTAIFASFERDGEQRTVLLRVEQGDVDLEKLSRLDRILDAVASRELRPEDAAREVRAVRAEAPRYGAWLSTLAFALLSGTAALFLGGGWLDAGLATLVGLVIGLASRWTAGNPSASQLFEPAAAAFASFTVCLVAGWTGQVAVYPATLGALIALLPGLGLTVALTELAARSSIAGSARFAGAALTFLTLGFGVAFGAKMASLLVPLREAVTPPSLGLPIELAALGVTAAGFAVLFKAHPREIPWILLAAASAFYGGRTGAAWLGPELGAFLGALMVGLASNLHARLVRRPAAVTQLPGIMLLVPGSIGFRSVAALMEHDAVAGIQAAFTMIVVGTALATGLLIANLLLPSRRQV